MAALPKRARAAVSDDEDEDERGAQRSRLATSVDTADRIRMAVSGLAREEARRKDGREFEAVESVIGLCADSVVSLKQMLGYLKDAYPTETRALRTAVGATTHDIDASFSAGFKRSVAPLTVMLLGGVSSGKSTAINALLGRRVVPMGIGAVSRCNVEITASTDDTTDAVQYYHPGSNRPAPSGEFLRADDEGQCWEGTARVVVPKTRPRSDVDEGDMDVASTTPVTSTHPTTDILSHAVLIDTVGQMSIENEGTQIEPEQRRAMQESAHVIIVCASVVQGMVASLYHALQEAVRMQACPQVLLLLTNADNLDENMTKEKSQRKCVDQLNRRVTIPGRQTIVDLERDVFSVDAKSIELWRNNGKPLKSEALPEWLRFEARLEELLNGEGRARVRYAVRLLCIDTCNRCTTPSKQPIFLDVAGSAQRLAKAAHQIDAFAAGKASDHARALARIDEELATCATQLTNIDAVDQHIVANCSAFRSYALIVLERELSRDRLVSVVQDVPCVDSMHSFVVQRQVDEYVHRIRNAVHEHEITLCRALSRECDATIQRYRSTLLMAARLPETAIPEEGVEVELAGELSTSGNMKAGLPLRILPPVEHIPTFVLEKRSLAATAGIVALNALLGPGVYPILGSMFAAGATLYAKQKDCRRLEPEIKGTALEWLRDHIPSSDVVHQFADDLARDLEATCRRMRALAMVKVEHQRDEIRIQRNAVENQQRGLKRLTDQMPALLTQLRRQDTATLAGMTLYHVRPPTLEHDAALSDWWETRMAQ